MNLEIVWRKYVSNQEVALTQGVLNKIVKENLITFIWGRNPGCSWMYFPVSLLLLFRLV